jgi:fluoroquinolone transport system permease protein
MLLKLTKYDILFQVKHGFYLVYGFITLMYLLVLFYLPHEYRPEVTAYFILSDTSLMGMIFAGALVLLEKQQNLLQSLFVTPLKLTTYLWAKALSLTLIAVIISSLIGFLPGGMINRAPIMLIAVTLTSLFFTFLGLGISARVSTINQYLATIMLGGIILISPIVLFFYFPQISVLFPVNAAIDMLIVPAEEQTIRGLIADISVLVCWNIVAFLFAKSAFLKYVIHN